LDDLKSSETIAPSWLFMVSGPSGLWIQSAGKKSPFNDSIASLHVKSRLNAQNRLR